MWNLSYGSYGAAVKLGTKAQPGKPVRHRKNKKQRQSNGAIAKKARQVYRIEYELESIPREERMTFLQTGLHKGAWISQALILQRRTEFDQNKKSLLNMNHAKCYVCRCKARHRHHVIPINRGGSNAKGNLVPLCVKCHVSLHPWLKENLLTAAGILPDTARDSEATGANPPVMSLTDSCNLESGRPVGACIKGRRIHIYDEITALELPLKVLTNATDGTYTGR